MHETRITRITFTVAVLLLLTGGVALAAPRDCTTPNRAMTTFLHWQNEPHVHMGVAAKCLDASAGQGDRRFEVARKLKFVLDKRGLYVNLDKPQKPEYVPDEADYQDPTTQEFRVDIFPDMIAGFYLVKVGDDWVISAETVSAADDLFRKTPGSWIAGFQARIPESLKRSVFGIPMWAYLGVLLIAFLGTLVRRIVSAAARKVLHTLFDRFFPQSGLALAKTLQRPLGTIGLAGVWWLLFPALEFPVRINEIAFIAIRVLVVLSIIAALYRLVDVLTNYWAAKAAKTDTKLDDQLVPLVRRAAKVFVVVIGALFILQNLRFDVGSLLAGLGIGGLAFALAAKDTLSNLFGSVMIFADRPFQIGDWVVVAGSTEGVVEEVGFRSTRIRTFYNSLVSVPNSKVADAIVDNYGQRKFRRTNITLGVTYDTTPEQIEAFCEGIRAIIAANEFTRKDYYLVHFKGFGAVSLDIMVYFFFAVDSWNKELEQKHNIFLEILRLAQRIGVEFAFPTQTLHLETVREPTAVPAKEVPGTAELSDAVDGFGPGGHFATPATPLLTDGYYCDAPVSQRDRIISDESDAASQGSKG